MAKRPKKNSNETIGKSSNRNSNEPKVVKNEAAVELGRLGGLKGGLARAAKLTPEERSAIARKAAQKRWSK